MSPWMRNWGVPLALCVVIGTASLFLPQGAKGTLGIGDLVGRLAEIVVLSSWVWFGCSPPFRDKWPLLPAWVRRVLVLAVPLFGVWWAAAFAAAIRVGDGYAIPVWARVALWLCATGLGAVVFWFWSEERDARAQSADDADRRCSA